jgi:MinD superfamily P-loop ATPase
MRKPAGMTGKPRLSYYWYGKVKPMHLKQYYIRPDRCTHCQRCLAVCPVRAIMMTETSSPEIENQKCKRCGSCKKICKQQAISYRVRLQY